MLVRPETIGYFLEKTAHLKDECVIIPELTGGFKEYGVGTWVAFGKVEVLEGASRVTLDSWRNWNVRYHQMGFLRKRLEEANPNDRLIFIDYNNAHYFFDVSGSPMWAFIQFKAEPTWDERNVGHFGDAERAEKDKKIAKEMMKMEIKSIHTTDKRVSKRVKVYGGKKKPHFHNLANQMAAARAPRDSHGKFIRKGTTREHTD